MAVINKVRGRKADAVADGSRSLPLDNTDDNETLADGYLANNANDCPGKYYHHNNTSQSQQQQQQQQNNNNTTSSDPVEVTIADGGTHQTCRQNGSLVPVPNGNSPLSVFLYISSSSFHVHTPELQQKHGPWFTLAY